MSDGPVGTNETRVLAIRVEAEVGVELAVRRGTVLARFFTVLSMASRRDLPLSRFR